MKIKVCSICNIEKDISLFYKDSKKPDGYRPDCKMCFLERNKDYYLKNKEVIRNRVKKYSKNNSEKIREYRKTYHEKNKEKLKKYQQDRYYNGNGRLENLESKLKKNYNLTLDGYNDLIVKQKGVCAICFNQCTSGKSLSVDHNHDTGKIRGLLCNRCNRGIGLMRDDAIILESAIKYLKENN